MKKIISLIILISFFTITSAYNKIEKDIINILDKEFGFNDNEIVETGNIVEETVNEKEMIALAKLLYIDDIISKQGYKNDYIDSLINKLSEGKLNEKDYEKIDNIHIYRSYYNYFYTKPLSDIKINAEVKLKDDGYLYQKIYNIGIKDLISDKKYDLNYLILLYNTNKWNIIDPLGGFIIITDGTIKKFKLKGIYQIKDFNLLND